MERCRKYIFLAIRALVALGGLALIFQGQDWSGLRHVFSNLNIIHFLFTLLIFTLCQAGGALRWWLLLQAQSIPLKVAAVARLHFLGLFYNNFMPSSVGGDVLKAWYATKHSKKRFEAALSVFVDRIIGLCGIFIMAIISYAFIMQKGMLPDSEKAKKYLLFYHNREPEKYLAACLVILIVTFIFLTAFRGSRTFLIGISRRIFAKLCEIGASTKEAMIIYCQKPVYLLVSLGLTLFFQSLVILAFWILGRSIQIEAGLKYYFVIFPAMWIVGAIPISIAGIGILEGSITVLFVQLAKTTPEQAICLALCQRFILILTSLPGASIQLFGSHLPKALAFDIGEKESQKIVFGKTVEVLLASDD